VVETSLCGEAVMVEPWESLGKDVMAGTHRVQEGAFSGVRGSHWR
jgi:hypothetical protein